MNASATMDVGSLRKWPCRNAVAVGNGEEPAYAQSFATKIGPVAEMLQPKHPLNPPPWLRRSQRVSPDSLPKTGNNVWWQLGAFDSPQIRAGTMGPSERTFGAIWTAKEPHHQRPAAAADCSIVARGMVFGYCRTHGAFVRRWWA